MLLVQDVQQIQSKAVATISLISGAHMNISITIKLKILVLIKWSIRSPNLC
jgi:hypothetical protein